MTCGSPALLLGGNPGNSRGGVVEVVASAAQLFVVDSIEINAVPLAAELSQRAAASNFASNPRGITYNNNQIIVRSCQIYVQQSPEYK